MVLNIISFFILIILSGCATTGGYERYGIYDERHDRIYEHRTSFLDDGRISMAYSIVYWDILQIKEEKREEIPEVYYTWLRNNTDQTILIDSHNLSLFTEKGEVALLSPLTEGTPVPLEAQEIEPYDIAAGYVVFEIPRKIIESDRPSRLIYDDRAGNRAVRYLQIEDMKRYEGLILEKRVYYYAPVYPRRYWYPYYYPYEYYPYDIHFYYFYSSEPYRHYYYIPVEPKKKREFYVPSPPKGKKREFQRSDGSPRQGFENQTIYKGSEDNSGGGIFNWFLDLLSGGGSDKEEKKVGKEKKGREF